MDELARRVGVSKMTLYKMAGSKEQLLREILLAEVRGVQLKLAEIMEQHLPWPKRLEAVLETFPSLVARTGGTLFKEAFHAYPAIEVAVRQHLDGVTESIICFMEEGISLGIVRSKVEGRFLLEILKGIVIHLVALSAHPEESIRASFDIVLHGVLA